MSNDLVPVVERLMGPLWVLGLSTVYYFFRKQKARQKMHLYDRIHAERMKAIEQGIPYPELPPYIDEEEEKTVQRVEMKRLNPRWPLGLAAILICGGIGALAALILSPAEEFRKLWTFSFIPIFVGIGSCLHYFILKMGDKNDQ